LANRLAPAAAWVFVKYVRWLLQQQRESEVLALLEARKLDKQWTAGARDELRSEAFEQRAQRALTAGDTAQAKVDLELAVRYGPNSPWTRYRLAGLYARTGEPERGRLLFTNVAASDEMRYARSLYLASIDALDEAFAAVDG